MKYINLASLIALVAHFGIAHEPIGVTAKTLDEHLEVIIHHPSADSSHHINHVIIMRGNRVILDKDFDAQTDAHSLDIQIPHPHESPRKRIKKRARIRVYATCNQKAVFDNEVLVH